MKWLGRPWVEGEHECSHFVAAVLAEEFGTEIDLPAPGATVRERDSQIHDGLAAGRAIRTTCPRDGDGVLTVMAGGRRVRDFHIGVYVAATEPLMLHCLEGGQSCLTAIRALPAIGQELEGFYRWRS